MNDAERDLIAGLFRRIRAVETAQRDPEAEAYISDQVSQQPHAPYAMAQTLVVQDQSLRAAQARIEQLEREIAELREGADRPTSFGGPEARPAAAPSPSPSPWGPRAQESMARAEAARSGGVWDRSDRQLSPPFGAPQTGYGQQPGYGAPPPRTEEPSRGGGFLSTALQTAAGVAAGALIFQGAKSIFGGGDGSQGATEAARAESNPSSDAASAGDGGTTQDIGDWYSGLFGGSDSASGDDPSDDGGDWT